MSVRDVALAPRQNHLDRFVSQFPDGRPAKLLGFELTPHGRDSNAVYVELTPGQPLSRRPAPADPANRRCADVAVTTFADYEVWISSWRFCPQDGRDEEAQRMLRDLSARFTDGNR